MIGISKLYCGTVEPSDALRYGRHSKDLPSHLLARHDAPVATSSKGRTLKEALEGPERQIILEVLQANNWNRNVTADMLGINRTTLYKKMKRLKLEDPRQAMAHSASFM